MRELRPLYDRVVVRLIDEGNSVKNGIVIPDSAQEKPQEGEVIAAAPFRIANNGERLPMMAKVGDRILFAKYAGTELKIDGEPLLILREEEILTVYIPEVKLPAVRVKTKCNFCEYSVEHDEGNPPEEATEHMKTNHPGEWRKALQGDNTETV